MKLFPETLPDGTLELVKRLPAEPLSGFYLSGGTALSLQIGHRESEALVFFSQKDFDPAKLQQQLETLGQLEKTELAPSTLNTYINGVHLQFLHYPYQLLHLTSDWEKIRLSSVIDIACTKIQTIGARGSKKDFVDLYFLLKNYSLNELLTQTEAKYPKTDYNLIHILKSLTYFNDANVQPMPRMHREVSWEEVKQTITQIVKNFQI